MGDNMKKILVVDDEPDVLKYLETIFLDNGFDVVTAVNGMDCFSIAKANNPDLITLDISMPSESGVRAFRDLQEDASTKDIPVIIITGISSEFKRFISTRKQVHPPVDFFEKPVDRDLLIKRVKEILDLN